MTPLKEFNECDASAPRLLAVPLLSAPLRAHAQSYHMIGDGSASCGAWTADRAQPNSTQAFMDEDWVLGFLSGVGARLFDAAVLSDSPGMSGPRIVGPFRCFRDRSLAVAARQGLRRNAERHEVLSAAPYSRGR